MNEETYPKMQLDRAQEIIEAAANRVDDHKYDLAVALAQIAQAQAMVELVRRIESLSALMRLAYGEIGEHQ